MQLLCTFKDLDPITSTEKALPTKPTKSGPSAPSTTTETTLEQVSTTPLTPLTQILTSATPSNVYSYSGITIILYK